jgi:hypothetical protein
MTGHIVSLVWPGVLAFLVWLFRDKIRELLPGSRFKKGDLEIVLGRAEEVAAKLPPVENGVEHEMETSSEEFNRFLGMAKISPRGAVLELRSDLEAAVIRAAKLHAEYESPPATVETFIDADRYLREHGYVGPATSRLLGDLRSIGNSVAHGGAADLEEAIRYRQLTIKAMARLRQVADKA